MQGYDLREALDHIDPRGLAYNDWLKVGLALKFEGYTLDVWDSWSRSDPRYKQSDCTKRWDGFSNSAASSVTGGTIVKMAKDAGWVPPNTSYDLDYDSVITVDDPAWLIADVATIRSHAPVTPMFDTWDPAREIITYLETMYSTDDYVNVVTKSYDKEGKFLPSSVGTTKYAGDLIEALSRCNGDIGNVFGDYNKAAGAWIRINPLDGNGVKNDNVEDFKYCLIESDSMPIDDQAKIIRSLELPVAALVHSGGKSVHAIVKVDAADRKQYDERVRHIIEICNANGLEVDTSNKNPARLSRLPGCERGDQRQYLIATNIGRADYMDWMSWRSDQTDGLPEASSFVDEIGIKVESSDLLIEGMLSKGEKLMLAGPSKAGKSFSLMELCAAFASGGTWLGKQCSQIDVLYINLELKKETRIRRLQDIFTTLSLDAKAAVRIHCMDLRGKNVTLEKLTAKLVKQTIKKECKVVIIDPIYKVLAGDENSSEDVSKFCVALDYLIEKLGVSVIYCHHYSKGAAGYADTMNRASGSSVFSRDADALITLDEIPLDEDRRKARFNVLGCELCTSRLDQNAPENWRERLHSIDDLVTIDALRNDAREILDNVSMNALIDELDALEAACMDARYDGLESGGNASRFPAF